MNRAVLDASAVLAFLFNEPGADVVRPALAGGLCSAVNYAEVLTRLAERAGSPRELHGEIDRLELELVPFDADQAALTADLRPRTRSLGLSLADRACLALGLVRSVPVMTADRSWGRLDLGVEIIQVRTAA